MGWWRWAAAIVEAVLLLVLVLLWYDSLRDRKGWGTNRAGRAALLASVSVPIGFALMLFVPYWLALALITIPALAVAAMALAS